MELAEWEKLPQEQRVSLPQDELFSTAAKAAADLINRGHWDAESAYVGNRFGEPMLFVYIPDELFNDPYPNRSYAHFGFKIIFQPASKKFPGLEEHAGGLYFQRSAT